MLSAAHMHDGQAHRTGPVSAGSTGDVHQITRRLGLDRAINRRWHVFTMCRPAREFDHVLSITQNLPAGGTWYQGDIAKSHSFRRFDLASVVASYLGHHGEDLTQAPGDSCQINSLTGEPRQSLCVPCGVPHRSRPPTVPISLLRTSSCRAAAVRPTCHLPIQ